MIHQTTCPICDSTDIRFSLSAVDNTVSKQTFDIWKCNKCTAKFTQDIPEEHEIGPYYNSPEYVSHSDTNAGLINKLYHYVRNITIRGKRNLVRKETGIAAGSILDIGCGTGAFLNAMQEGGWQVTGLEPDATAVSKAKQLYNIDAVKPETLFHLTTNSFDAITMWHVLEHVHQLHEYMEQCRELLKPGGILFIAVPNHTSYDAEKYKEAWAAYDVPRHLYHFSPRSMNVLVNKHGMKVKAMKPMLFDSYYVSMLSEKIKGENNIPSAVIQGTLSNAKAILTTARCSSIIYVIKKA